MNFCSEPIHSQLTPEDPWSIRRPRGHHPGHYHPFPGPRNWW